MGYDRMRLAQLLRQAQGKDRSLRRFAEEAGISSSYVSRLMRGIVEEPPSAEILKKLASVARNGVTYTDLLQAAGRLDDSDVEKLIQRWRTEVPYYRDEHLYVIPLLGSIPAGIPIDRIEDIEGYVSVDPLILSGAEGFALRVKGDSMSGDRIYDGDIVIVRRQDTVDPTDIAVVAVNDHEATLKRVQFTNGQAILVSSNPDYEPMIVPADQVKIIGKVVEVRFQPRRKR